MRSQRALIIADAAVCDPAGTGRQIAAIAATGVEPPAKSQH
jgi:hypothetical protein